MKMKMKPNAYALKLIRRSEQSVAGDHREVFRSTQTLDISAEDVSNLTILPAGRMVQPMKGALRYPKAYFEAVKRFES